MRRLITLLVITLGLLTACGPRAEQPTATPLPPTAAPPTSTSVAPVDLTPAQVAAIGALSDALGTPLDQIKIVSTEATDWADSCLGIIHPNLGCAQAITPGFRIFLEADQLRYEYHTDQSGNQITGATLALTWHRSGGIAGFCDDLQVYLSGETYGSSCKTGDAYPAGKLTVEEMKQLADWAKAFASTSVQVKDPAVADAMTLQLTFTGSGTTQAVEADQALLFNFAQAVYDRLKPCC